MIKHPGEVNEEIVPILERTVLPNDFSAPILEGAVVIGQESADPQLWPAIGLAVAGAALIFLMERFAAPKTKSA
jgi:hypothetical protein